MLSAEILVAAITSFLGLCGVIITSVFGYLIHKNQNQFKGDFNQSKEEISQINDAVNHRHDKKGQDAPKLYDMMWENHLKADELIQWKRGYDGGPLDDGTKVQEFFDETNDRLGKIENKLTESPPCVAHDILNAEQLKSIQDQKEKNE